MAGLLLLIYLAIGPMAVTAQAAWDARLEMHAPETTARFNAVCLDGSPAGYYVRPASTSAAATKWKFHFCGGGWCTSEEDCYNRGYGGSPRPQMGSSTSWPPWLSSLLDPPGAAFYGLMSFNDSAVNPFGEWNFVWLAYCDGSSQLSDRDAPFSFNGSLVHLRGRAILDAHLYELERVHGFLSTATEASEGLQYMTCTLDPGRLGLTADAHVQVVISGTSAGGLSTYLQSSYINTQLRAPGARLVAVPDAGACVTVSGAAPVKGPRAFTPTRPLFRRVLVGHAELRGHQPPVARPHLQQHLAVPLERDSARGRWGVPRCPTRRSAGQVLLPALRVCLLGCACSQFEEEREEEREGGSNSWITQQSAHSLVPVRLHAGSHVRHPVPRRPLRPQNVLRHAVRAVW
jgi:hypothetical protein